ncbi:MAG: hypothetical protein CL662_07315 [Bacteroidetes bacterium]|nr:hypothetical protein [Bacteroidota bacterium]HCI69671.1 hypothetical protein [Balneola sp.]|tara:strand:+ start:1715 stop:2155 length:441 start_codon:yes stop_codon:yes gene_type:complete
MGQQQILLILVVTVIAGVATVVAINTMSSTLQQNNIDAVRVDLSVIAAQMQAYYQKPRGMGGGSKSFVGVTFDKIAFQTDSIDATGMIARNGNAIFNIESATNAMVVLTAQPSTGPVMAFDNLSNSEITQRAEVTLSGVEMRYQVE